jgi:competence protein ComEA
MLKKILAIVAMLYAAACFAAVDANKATAAELDSIKGIGPGISTKILDERKKGTFKDWNDLVERVKGVGEGNAAKFSAEGMTVNGQTFKGAAAPAAAKKEDKKADAKAAAAAAAPAAASAAAPAKVDAKADAKAKAAADKEAAKKAKADEKAAKAEEAKKAKEAKADTAKPAAKPAASAASAAKK